MSKQHSIEEMQTQIRQLKTTIALPGVPADEIAIYQATIQRIQAEIQARQSAPAPLPAEASAKAGEQIKHNTPPPPPPPPLYVTPPIGGGAGGGVDAHRERQALTPNQQPATSNQQPITPRVIAPAQLTPDQRAALSAATIAANLYATPPTVTINWPPWDWGPRTYTEGEARGALTTALRDLSESKLARQGRYSDLTRYAAWWRSIHYYRALTQFWGMPPTRAQLQLTRRDNVFTTIFNMVTEAAAQTQSQP